MNRVVEMKTRCNGRCTKDDDGAQRFGRGNERGGGDEVTETADENMFALYIIYLRVFPPGRRHNDRRAPVSRHFECVMLINLMAPHHSIG